MRSGIIARKLGMSSIFDDNGVRTPVTFLRVDDCQVVGQRTQERDGYNALMIGAESLQESKLGKSQAGFFKKNNVSLKRKVKEFRVSQDNLAEIGTEMKVGYFKPGQFVDVRGISKGKGFAGAMKRHNFGGLEASHGVSVSHRSHGSTGGCQDPGRVFKNKKMAGHLGDAKVTLQNLVVERIDEENNLILVRGSVPGGKNSLLMISDSVKKNTL